MHDLSGTPQFLVLFSWLQDLSAGAAATLILSKNPAERKQFARIDLIIIGIELFLIIHMFMGFLASTQVQIDAAEMFLGGALYYVILDLCGDPGT